MNLFEHPEHKGYYADQKGKIYHFKKGYLKEKHQCLNMDGYYIITLTPINCKTINIRSHRFIYECNTSKSLPKIIKKNYNKNSMTVDHIDGNKLNNSFKNLQAISNSDNIKKYHRNEGHVDYDGTSAMRLQSTNCPKIRELISARLKKEGEKQRDYQKNYVNNPINKLIRNERSIFHTLKNTLSSTQFTKHNLSAELFHKFSKAKLNKQYVLHVISILNLLTFNKKLPRYILHDDLNIELHAERPHDFSLVTSNTLIVATLLEAKYPVELTGLCEYLKPLQQMVAV